MDFEELKYYIFMQEQEEKAKRNEDYKNNVEIKSEYDGNESHPNTKNSMDL